MHEQAKKYLTTSEASTYTGIPVQTLRTFRSQNRGPIYSKPAGRCMYNRDDLDDYMASGRRIPSARASKDRSGTHVAV